MYWNYLSRTVCSSDRIHLHLQASYWSKPEDGGHCQKTLQIFHHHYTVKDKAQEAVFFTCKYISYKFISGSPENGDTSQIYFRISWKGRYQPKGECVISLDDMKLLSTKSITIHRNNWKIVTHHSWYESSLQGSFRLRRSNMYVCYYTFFFLTQPKILL